MVNSDLQKEPFFSTGLDPEEIQVILDRIDENLTIRQIISRDSPHPAGAERVAIPDLPQLNNLVALSDWLKMSSAPLRPTIGIGGIRGVIFRVLNLPVRIFATGQILFNRKLRDFIHELVGSTQALHIQATGIKSGLHDLENKTAIVTDLENKVQSLLEEVQSLREQLYTAKKSDATLREHLGRTENLLNENILKFETRFDTISETQTSSENRISNLEKQMEVTTEYGGEIDSLRQWMARMDVRQRGTEDWVRLIGEQTQDVSREMRIVGEQKSPPQFPQIINPAAFAKKIRAMGEKVKVNIGAGHRPLETYINIDFRELPGTDVVSDANSLPFPPESLDEISSSHLVEHFREYVFTSRILPYWFSLIKKGGKIRVICPNWQAMLDRLQSGAMTLQHFKLLTFGGQDYDGNDHHAMYTPDTLSQLLIAGGFDQIQVLATDRENDGCPEMELVAEKPL